MLWRGRKTKFVFFFIGASSKKGLVRSQIVNCHCKWQKRLMASDTLSPSLTLSLAEWFLVLHFAANNLNSYRLGIPSKSSKIRHSGREIMGE